MREQEMQRLGVTGWARVNADGSLERVEVDESHLVDGYGSGWAGLSHLDGGGMEGTWTIGPFTVETKRKIPKERPEDIVHRRGS
jgi:hypothetical protein